MATALGNQRKENMSENKLISIVNDDVQIEKLVQRDQFLAVVNTPPPNKLIKEHPFAKGVKYLPIETVELLLTRLFQEWHVEIKDTKQLLNSLSVTVRLHYKDPIDGEYRWQDGVGAVPAKTNKGAAASDMSAILSDAVMTGLPAAESFAVKDAAEKIGKLFGKDLNRKDSAAFTAAYATTEVLNDIEVKKQKLREDLSNASL